MTAWCGPCAADEMARPGVEVTVVRPTEKQMADLQAYFRKQRH
jgi:hypothetical protein